MIEKLDNLDPEIERLIGSFSPETLNSFREEFEAEDIELLNLG